MRYLQQHHLFLFLMRCRRRAPRRPHFRISRPVVYRRLTHPSLLRTSLPRLSHSVLHRTRRVRSGGAPCSRHPRCQLIRTRTSRHGRCKRSTHALRRHTRLCRCSHRLLHRTRHRSCLCLLRPPHHCLILSLITILSCCLRPRAAGPARVRHRLRYRLLSAVVTFWCLPSPFPARLRRLCSSRLHPRPPHPGCRRRHQC